MIFVRRETGAIGGITCNACGATRSELMKERVPDLKLVELHVGHSNFVHVTTLCVQCLEALHTVTRGEPSGDSQW